MSAPSSPRDPLHDSGAAPWLTVLENAVYHGDFRLAEEARDALRELGFEVHMLPRLESPGQPAARGLADATR